MLIKDNIKKLFKNKKLQTKDNKFITKLPNKKRSHYLKPKKENKNKWDNYKKTKWMIKNKVRKLQ